LEVATIREEAEEKAVALIQAQIAGHETRMQFLEVNNAVRTIQGIATAGKARRDFKVKKDAHLRASQIQGTMVGKEARREVTAEHEALLEAALEKASDGTL